MRFGRDCVARPGLGQPAEARPGCGMAMGSVLGHVSRRHPSPLEVQPCAASGNVGPGGVAAAAVGGVVVCDRIGRWVDNRGAGGGGYGPYFFRRVLEELNGNG